MEFFSDLHLHSSYSRATSPKMNITELSEAAKVKGVNLLGTGDFTHPKHYENIKRLLTPVGNGFFIHNDIYFLLTNEISNMYPQDGKGRRVHNVLFVPNFEILDQLNEGLKKWGRVDYDGRPIFGKTSIELVELCMSISKDILVIPAHAWTPWFGILGSKSGFDSLEECFKDQMKNIYAIETGLSSDPALNSRLSALDNITLVSFSDSHSPYPWRLGREATVFDLKEPSYYELIKAIKEKDSKKLLYTIEVDPSYGKYHIDGHRNCNISMMPEESKKHNNICPVCKKPLTIGVLNRVEELADRPEGYTLKNAIPFKKLIPLSEIIAAMLGTTVATKAVWGEFNKLVDSFSSEYNILLKAPEKALKEITHPKLAEAIMKNREGKIEVKPGYDGVYGVPMLEKIESTQPKSQKTLGDY